MPGRHLLPLFVLIAVTFLVAGCAPALSPEARTALDRAGLEMDRQLTPAGQLAATAALIYDNRGAFPTTRFELLGSSEALLSGARGLGLSALEVEQTVEGLRIDYILLPTAEDPTDRMGSVLVRPADGSDQFEADVRLTRREDPDHGGRPLFLAQEDQIGVTRLRGTFCIDLAVVREQAAANEAGDLPLDARPYTITFTPSPPRAEGVPAELQRGYTVTIGA